MPKKPFTSESYATYIPVVERDHFRTLRTIFLWAVVTGLIPENPMRGLSMRTPRTLPRIPEDETVRRLLGACSDTLEGRRNRVLVALLADGGLRIREALRLAREDVNFASRVITVRAGKGQQDGIGFFGAETAQVLRAWLGVRADAVPEDFLFTDALGRPLTRDYGTHLLHRLAVRAGLPHKIGPTSCATTRPPASSGRRETSSWSARCFGMRAWRWLCGMPT